MTAQRAFGKEKLMKKSILAVMAVLVTSIVLSLVPVMSNASSELDNVKDATIRAVLADSIVVAEGSPNAIFYGKMVKLDDDYSRPVAVKEDDALYVPTEFAKTCEAGSVQTTEINGTSYVAVSVLQEALGLQAQEAGGMIVLSKNTDLLQKAVEKAGDMELLFGLYVSPDGETAGLGTFARPILNMEQAKSRVQSILSRIGFVGNEYTVYFRGGLYNVGKSIIFDTTDSAPEGCTIVYDAYPGEEPQFDGSLSLTGSQLTKVASGSAYTRLPSAAKGNVYSIDLNQFGYVPGTDNPNDQYVFYAGERFTLARWPNYDNAYTDKAVKASGTVADPGVTSTIKDYDKISTWATATEPWVNASFLYTWANQNFRMVVNTDDNTIGTKENPQYSPIGNNKTYYVYNMLEELDIEGEYYIDRQTNTFYIYPYKSQIADGSFATNTINIGTLKTPMLDINGTKGVAFRRLTLQNSVGTMVDVNAGDKIEVAGCTIRNTAGLGVNLNPATNTVIKSNDFYNTGNTAVYIYGGSIYEVELSGNEVVNNRMYDIHRAINDNYYEGYGGYVAHNEVSRTSEQFVSGIVCGCTYEYNEIGDTGTRRVADSGTMYTYSYPYVSERVIRNNYFHDTDGTMCVIYFDNNSFGARCFGNIFYRTSRPFFSNGGENDIWRNNLSIDQMHSEYGDEMLKIQAAASDGYSWDPNTHTMIKDSGTHYQVTMTSRMGKVNWEKWKTAFPYFYNVYWNQKYFDLPYNSYIENNVSVRSGGFYVDNKSEPYVTVGGNLEYNTADDVGFVDYKNQNFNLRDDSVVYQDNPNLEKFDYFEEIGLYTDEYRTELPKWDDDSFDMLVPANKSEDVDANEVVFKWQGIANTRKFRFMLATDPEFKNIVRDEIVLGTNMTVKNLRYDESRYYWKVIAMNNNMKNFDVDATLNPVSSYFSFTTAAEEIVDIRTAREAISNAEKVGAKIVEGTEPGNHREGTLAMYEEAMQVFKDYVDAKDYTQKEINKAITNFNSKIQGINARKINETITLDEQIGILGNWSFQPNVAFSKIEQDTKKNYIEYQRITATDNPSGGLEVPIENYQTIQYDLETERGNQWIYFGLRANKTTGSYGDTTLYFVGVNSQGLELQKWGSGARIYVQYFGEDFMLKDNERYSIEYGAVDDENGNVHITFKVNGRTMIDFVDDTADKITDTGCFTVYESSPGVIVRLLPYTGIDTWADLGPAPEGNRQS